VTSHLRVNHFSPECFESRQRAGLVLAHETAVADDISCQNGRKPALEAFFSHEVPALSEVFIVLLGCK
jgi:hypothetical protein